MLDELYRFQVAFHRDPRSWADFSAGLQHVVRLEARRRHSTAWAVRMAHHQGKHWKEWEQAHAIMGE